METTSNFTARVALAEAALKALLPRQGRSAEILREVYIAERDASISGNHPREVSEIDDHHRVAVEAKRQQLIQLRQTDQIDEDVFRILEKELDYAELSAARPDDHNLVEG